MSYTIPEPHKVRAIRIPADGSHPHLITLETLMLEPDPPQKPVSYHGLLSQLQEEENRHVPNLLVFWGLRGWKSRDYFKIEYECEEKQILEGHYYVFRSLESDGLQVNKHLSSHVEEAYGDVFVLKVDDGYEWRDGADLHDVMGYLEEMRNMYLYPEYLDVDEVILRSDIVESIARLLLRNAESAESDVQMDYDDEETQSNASSISDGEVRTSAETGDGPGHDSTAPPSPRGAGEIQEEEGESTDRDLP